MLYYSLKEIWDTSALQFYFHGWSLIQFPHAKLSIFSLSELIRRKMAYTSRVITCYFLVEKTKKLHKIPLIF